MNKSIFIHLFKGDINNACFIGKTVIEIQEEINKFMRKKSLNKKQRRSLMKFFLISLGVTSALSIFVVAIAIRAYETTLRQGSESQIVHAPLTDEEKVFEEQKEEVSELNKTIAVFGVDDEEIRTDVIFVVNFNTETNKVKVVSVPRDTKVNWTDKQQRAYTQLTGNHIRVSKLNEMASYGRINQNVGNIRDFTVDELENILEVHIDHYIVINLEAFGEIVDAIGGVEIDVPQRMYYRDRAQNLYIDLQPGMQHLNADQAEQLVRFRQYPKGDEQRIAVQQQFLRSVAEKVLAPETIMQLPQIVAKVFPYVKTDIKLNEVLGYLDIVSQFSLNSLSTVTVPGYASSEEGPSYYYIDDIKLGDMIQEIFYDTEIASDDEAELSETVDIDKEVSISIYNAAGIKGIAGRYKDKLMDEGYKVEEIDNYEVQGLEQTTIYAKDKEKARQFLPLIKNAIIEEDDSIPYDIKIVIGKASLE